MGDTSFQRLIFYQKKLRGYQTCEAYVTTLPELLRLAPPSLFSVWDIYQWWQEAHKIIMPRLPSSLTVPHNARRRLKNRWKPSLAQKQRRALEARKVSLVPRPGSEMQEQAGQQVASGRGVCLSPKTKGKGR